MWAASLPVALLAVQHAAVAAAAAPPLQRLPRIPTLQDPREERPGSPAVLAAGHSHAADFAHQFQVAFSEMVHGACIFSGQPYHCAVTKFEYDAEVEQTPESGVPYCEGCSAENRTLIFNHCKNHPEWVDEGVLVAYPRRACIRDPATDGRVIPDCIDDPDGPGMRGSRVFLFRGTEDRCYYYGAVENVQGFYGILLEDPAAQMVLWNNLSFPHVMPVNSTPLFNSSAEKPGKGFGFDGPGECLKWVFKANKPNNPLDYPSRLPYAALKANVIAFDQREFFLTEEDATVGFKEFGYLYLPPVCRGGEGAAPVSSKKCKLILLTNHCTWGKPFADKPGEEDYLRYAETNGYVVLQPCIGGYFDRERWPNAEDVARGELDSLGQLGPDYAMQSGPHMRIAARMLRRVLYGESNDGEGGEADQVQTNRSTARTREAELPFAVHI